MGKTNLKQIFIMISTFTVFAVIFVLLLSFRRVAPQNSKPMSTPKSTLRTPKPAKNNIPITLSAWIAYWDDQKPLISLENNVASMNQVSPMWYEVTEQGLIDKKKEVSNRDAIYNLLTKSNKQIIPTITNEFNRNKVLSLITNQGNIAKTVAFLIQEAQSNG